MPIEGDIIDSSFAPQIRLFDTNNGSNKMKGGVTEFIRAKYDVRIYWYAEPTTFSVFDNGGEIKRNDGKSFFDDGFQIGGDIVVQYGFGASPAGQNGSGSITAISEDGFTLFSSVSSLINGNYDSTVECLITGTSVLTQAIYRFGLIENKESFNTKSKLTGDDQKYYVEDLQIGVPKFGVISGTIKGWAGSTESIIITRKDDTDIPKNRAPNFGGSGGTVTTGSVLNYTIQHTFPMLPYYVVGQLQNLKNLVAPSFLSGNNSLKHVFEATFKQNISDEEDNKQLRFQSLNGSIGFFNENFNGLQSQYSIESVDYVAVSSGLDNPSLLVQGITRVTIVINSSNGTFTSSTPIIATHSYLPLDESEYLESQDYFNDNFAFENVPNGAGGSIITSVVKTLLSPSQLQVELLVDVSGVKPTLTEESNYIIALTVENELLSQENSDRTTLQVDVNTYDLDPDIPDLLIVDKFKSYDHVNDITEVGFSDYKGWVQDGYAVQGTFKLDRTKFAFLQNISIDLVAWKDGTNEYFTIQTNSFNLSNSIVDNDGNQQINIQGLQGFKLDSLDQFNQKNLTTGAFDGTFIEYNFLLGLKINWQDWLSNPNADKIFYDVSQPNNGLNQNSSRYSLKEGYTLQTILKADVLEEEQNISTEYIHKSSMDVNAFDEIGIEDWSGVIETEVEETSQDAFGSVLGTGNTTIIRARFTPNFATTPDINEFEGIIRIVEQLPQGDKTIYELSSVRTSQANNLLIPLTGEPLTKVSLDGSDILLECRTDKTLIQNVKYTLSARLLGGGAVVLGDYNDDFSNDFFV